MASAADALSLAPIEAAPVPVGRHYEYRRCDELGRGAYGVVYAGVDTRDGSRVAVKQYSFPRGLRESDEGIPASTVKEVSLLKELAKHPHHNVLQLRDAVLNAGGAAPTLTLVMELCEGSDLQTELSRLRRRRRHADSRAAAASDGGAFVAGTASGGALAATVSGGSAAAGGSSGLSPAYPGLPPALARSYTYQLLAAVAHLHARGITHRDIKPANLLLSGDKQTLKLADFGLAAVEGVGVKKYAHEVQTLWWRAPEAILGSVNLGRAIDLWSVGAVFAEMAVGDVVFRGLDGPGSQLEEIFKKLGAPTEASWPGLTALPRYAELFPAAARRATAAGPACGAAFAASLEAVVGREGMHLVHRLLQVAPCERAISAADALVHPYFTGYVPSAAIGGAVPAELLDAVASVARATADDDSDSDGVDDDAGDAAPSCSFLGAPPMAEPAAGGGPATP